MNLFIEMFSLTLVSKMTYNVSNGTLNCTMPYYSVKQIIQNWSTFTTVVKK